MNPKERLAQAEARVAAAVRLEKPDRVPIVLFMDAYAARQQKLPLAEFISDMEKGRQVMEQTFEDIGNADGVLLGTAVTPTLFTTIWPTQIKLPGRELPPDQLWQFHETHSWLEVDDYDTIARIGWNAFFPTLLGRITGMTAQQFGNEMGHIAEQTVRDVQQWQNRGAVYLCAAALTPAFETLSGARTMAQFMMDLYRYPEKVVAAMDAMTPDLIETAKMAARLTGIPRIFLGATRGSTAFISLKQFERFFWPYIKKMVGSLVDDGITVLLHFDQDWTANLPYFKELPRAKCILHTDGMTDLFKAKEILGNHMCLKGDVHPTLLTLGTPEEVATYTRRLIDEVGAGGGFILSQGCDIPLNAKPENVKAMVDTCRAYGVYQ